jgi:hypothetical protein
VNETAAEDGRRVEQWDAAQAVHSGRRVGGDRRDEKTVPTKIMTVLGTRPEAIKLAPVILQAQARPAEFDVTVCVTAQHREMLDQVLELFRIAPDLDLGLMRPDQNLCELTASIITARGVAPGHCVANSARNSVWPAWGKPAWLSVAL